MSISTLTYTENNVLVDPVSVKFSDPTGTYGLRDYLSRAIIIPDGTDLTKISVGVYQYDIPNLDSEYWIEIVDSDGTVNHYRCVRKAKELNLCGKRKSSNGNIYELKMQVGQPIDLYYNVSNIPDLDTGDVTLTKSKICIRRAVISSIQNKYKFFNQSDSIYNKDDIVVTIDIRDLQGYTNNKEDYFVYRGKKHTIVSHEEVENDSYIFVIRAVQREQPNQEIVLNIQHYVGVKSDQS